MRSKAAYGPIAISLHWLVALLIFGFRPGSLH